jgi:hypothetical protein
VYCRGINKECQGTEGVFTNVLHLGILPQVSYNAFGRTDEIRTVNPAWAAKATTIEAIEVRAICRTMVDQPEEGGQSLAKEEKDPAPRSEEWSCGRPDSSDVHVGGKHERFFCRLGFQGTTATARHP